MRFLITGCLIATVLAVSFGKQQSQVTRGKPWVGGRGIVESVAQIKQRTQATLKENRETGEEAEFEASTLHWPSRQNPAAPFVSQWPEASVVKGGSVRREPFSPQTIGVDFRAEHSKTVFPPDCSGGVGPSQILVCTNDTINTFTKNGTYQPTMSGASTSGFFYSVRDTGVVNDPHVVFDPLSQRWFIVAINFYSSENPNRILIAVSSGATITSRSDFTFFEFRQDSVGGFPNSDSGGIADYPTLGVDANALYICADIFILKPTFKFVGSTAFVVRKSSVLGGGPIIVTAFRQLCTDSLHGPFAPQGATNHDPSATEGYIAGVDAISYGLLQFRRITDPGGTPAISANLSLNVPATYTPTKVPAKGSTYPLDALDDRLSAVYIENGRLWASHAIAVNSSGVADTSGSGRDAVRFYEIDGLSTTPSLIQSGTLYTSAASNPLYYWNPSIAVSGQENVAIGSSYAGANDYAGIAYSGRLSTDASGSIQPATFMAASSGYHPYALSFPPYYYRWGDFSTTDVDPNDNMTMWTIQEYTDSTPVSVTWGVRVTQLKAPPPPSLISASPDSVDRGASHVSVLITAASSNGSGFYDPGPGFPQRISALIGGGGVTVNSVAVVDPTHVTLDISIDTSAALGGRAVTVMNPDSQSVTASAPTILAIKVQSLSTISIPLSASWNLVSNPFFVANDSTGALFPGAATPAYSYSSPSGYQVSTQLQNGVGYWLRFNSSSTQSITGYPMADDSIPVTDGWNLIGSIGQSIQVGSIGSSPPGMITSKFFAYAGGYTITDSIKPGQGYWVKVSGSGWLVLSSLGTTTPSTRIRIIATNELPPSPPEDAVHGGVLPLNYTLGQAYPNPFNPSTIIKYQLPSDSRVTLKIYDLLGQVVSTLVSQTEQAGYKQVEWNASNFPSGIYFYRLEAAGIANPSKMFTQVRKMILLR